MSPAIVADLVKALEPFAELAGLFKLAEYADDDLARMKIGLLRHAAAAIARAKQLDLDRAAAVWDSADHNKYLVIPLRSEATDDARKEPV